MNLLFSKTKKFINIFSKCHPIQKAILIFLLFLICVLASPHTDRISRISEKLNGLQLGLESDKQGKYEQLDNRLKIMNDQFEEFQESMSKKFGSLKENVILIIKIQLIIVLDTKNAEVI